MATCRDCMCHLVCAIYAPNFDDILANGESCSEFKNKFNFVEVIRCKDCTHKNPLCDKCLRDNLWHDSDDFCSYGKRKVD